MTNLANHIDRILSTGECITAVEIALRLDAQFGGGRRYSIGEIAACADKMPNVYRSGNEYCCKREDAP
jgi:hypothetical protein